VKKIVFVFTCLCFLFSCNKDGKQDETSKEEIETSNKEIDKNNDSEGCFMAYQSKPCELITKEAIAGIFGIDVANIGQEDNMEVMTEPTLFACSFGVGEGGITVGQIEKTELQKFKGNYVVEYLPKDKYDLKYIEGFGESAAYIYKKDSQNTSLIVFQKGSLVKIIVYGNKKSQEENLDIAKKLALEILKKCS